MEKATMLTLLGLSGAAGTLARYGLAGVVQARSESFPWGTLSVNVLGCFLFGIVWALAGESDRMALSPTTRVLILSGFLGGFTTFSAFGFETAQLMRDSQWALAWANVAANNILGIALFLAGLALGRWL
ncbi:MAG: fluoride efflux transporter CrcB [Phycisphaeraceae bacterium]|nr:fluoride efflux transporter CrcB [Phycisphaeraceae bacterium]